MSWEYELLELKPDTWGKIDQEALKQHFNRLGRQGWQLVGISDNPSTGNSIAVFKRPGS